MATKDNQAPLGTGKRVLGGDENDTCFPKHRCAPQPHRRSWERNSAGVLPTIILHSLPSRPNLPYILPWRPLWSLFISVNYTKRSPTRPHSVGSQPTQQGPAGSCSHLPTLDFRTSSSSLPMCSSHPFCPSTDKLHSHHRASVLAVPSTLRSCLQLALCLAGSASISQVSAPVVFPTSLCSHLPPVTLSHSPTSSQCWFTFCFFFRGQVASWHALLTADLTQCLVRHRHSCKPVQIE